LVVAVVALVMLATLKMDLMAALALSSFATQILLTMPHPLQVHPHLPTLAGTKFTHGLAPAQLHSEVANGALCTT
jgi:hypothetical protein